MAGHLTAKLRVLREENTAGVEVTRLRTKVVTRSSSQQRTCLSPPVLSSPPSHSFFPRTPRPALHQSPHSLRPMMVPVSTNRRILAGETHIIPNHARARLSIARERRPALLVVTQVSGSRASFAAAKYRIMMDKWLVGVLWLAQTLRVSATVVHSSFHCLWQPETDFIYPEDPNFICPPSSLCFPFSQRSRTRSPRIYLSESEGTHWPRQRRP